MTVSKKSIQLLVLSTLSGLLLWASWPERGFSPLIFIAFVPLLLVVHHFIQDTRQKKIRRKMFAHFYWAMLLWNALTTWWIYNSTDVGSFVAIGLNSLFMAVVWLLFFVVKKVKGPVAGYASLFCFVLAFEFLHLNWEISWPWLTLGNVFATHPEYVQWYEYTGVLGGTIWVLAANIFFFLLAKNLFNRELLVRLRRINSAIAFAASLVILSAPLLLSKWIYSRQSDQGNPVDVVVVQPNIDPYNMKFSGNGDEQLVKMLQLASTMIDSTTDFVVFPETALPDGIWEENLNTHPQMQRIKKYINAFRGITIVIGASTANEYVTGEERSATARKFPDGNTWYDEYNTALMIDSAGSIQVYHKSRLVPGVEKMPYPKVFGFLESLAINLGGTSGSLGTQDVRANFNAPGNLQVAPAICYESIYGGFMSGFIRTGASLIFIITNDGWWGNTPGYRQHMHYGRLRAVEFRKSIARSANTGISCFINQRGDILQQTSWWEEDAIKQTIYGNTISTFYSRHGDYLGIAASVAAGALLFWSALRRFFRK